MLKRHEFTVQVPFKDREFMGVDPAFSKRVLLRRSYPRDFSEYSKARKRLAELLQKRELYGFSAGVASDRPEYVLERLPKELTIDARYPWHFSTVFDSEKKAREAQGKKKIDVFVIEWLYDFETVGLEPVTIDRELLEKLIEEDPIIEQLETEVKLTYSGYTYIKSIEEGQKVNEEHRRLVRLIQQASVKHSWNYEGFFDELIKIGFEPLTPYSDPWYLLEKKSDEEWRRHLECRNFFEKPFSDEISFLLNFRFLKRESVKGILDFIKSLFKKIDAFLFVYEKPDVEFLLKSELEECSKLAGARLI